MVTNFDLPNKVFDFATCLRQRAWSIHSWLCVGLDPDPDKLPAHLPRSSEGVEEFCRQIVNATADHAVAFKLNFAFYERFGAKGWDLLSRVRSAIPRDIPVVADAKRGDMANTSRHYAAAIFEELEFDAVTVSPYLGWDSLEPFVTYEGKGVFVLCRTSNPGGADLQELKINGEPLYRRVAREALSRDADADVGLVVGATQPAVLREIRSLDEEVLLLVPGVGAQGATMAEAKTASNRNGDNALLAASRNIIYAGGGRDFADQARHSAAALARESVTR